MNTSSWLATWLDWEMIEISYGGHIASPALPMNRLPLRTGAEVFDELGGRYLLRYLPERQVGLFGQGSTAVTYTTPTPYAPLDTISYLALPSPLAIRLYALVLDPRMVPLLRGPQWIRGGRGLQYILPDGFPPTAVVIPGGGTVGGWEILIQ